MNEDFTDRLPFGEVDFDLLGTAINAYAADIGWSLEDIGQVCGVSKMTISRAARGYTVNATTLLKLCVVMDLNPFDLLRKSDDVSHGTSTVTRQVKAGADG